MGKPATRFEDLARLRGPFHCREHYGDVDELRRLLEEVSKLLQAYSRAILHSDSCLPE